ncbi:hypothetical protein HOLleu_44739 [Holothuria leucospilota]|uniref:Tyr recombinase domain-containing protein n=1 Tax=Holothuria leucospilota TaxID=206669 RepID=A0A9Q0YA63_HOLLE|nr:hypothetical protein HOLleu_44739 [Holothuria leucospilota]
MPVDAECFDRFEAQAKANKWRAYPKRQASDFHIDDEDRKAFFSSPSLPDVCLDKLKASGAVDHRGKFRTSATKKSYLLLQGIDLAARTGMKFASSLLLIAEVLSKSFRQTGTEEVSRKDTGALVNILGPVARLSYDQFAKVAVKASFDRRELVLDSIRWPSDDIKRRFMELPLSGPDLFAGKFEEQLLTEIKRRKDINKADFNFPRSSSSSIRTRRSSPKPSFRRPSRPSAFPSRQQSIQGRSRDRPRIQAPGRNHPKSTSTNFSRRPLRGSSRLETFIRQLSSQGLSQEAAVLASEASLETVADFLFHIFKEGKQASTVKNYRSAISSIHEGCPDGSTIGSNNAIYHLLRGMFNGRPPRKRLSPSWSINHVLNSLSTSPFEPIHNTSLELLTHKTLFLLAAASARRRSELHALTTKRGFIRFSHNGVYLIPDPTFLTKNETASFSPGEIYLPNISSSSSIREDRKICPVRALIWYIEKTKNIRSSERLFLIPRSPYNPASKDTLSRWIVNLITPHIDNDDPVHAHQLRAHATSKAWFNGVSLSDILKAAAWKTPSTFVSCYLTDVVSNEGAFARSVLGISDQHRRPVLPPSCRC